MHLKLLLRVGRHRRLPSTDKSQAVVSRHVSYKFEVDINLESLPGNAASLQSPASSSLGSIHVTRLVPAHGMVFTSESIICAVFP